MQVGGAGRAGYEERAVRFGGGTPPRSGPLTLGQGNMLRCIADNEPAHINMHVVWDIPAGTPLEVVTGVLAELHTRHESLRTTFPADGPEPVQLVHVGGELAVEVHQAEGEPALFAEELGLRRRAVAFDPEGEWPMRAAVVTTGGRPTHLVLALSHAAVDATALGLLRREWLALLAGETLPEPAPVRPVDLAVIERSEEGRRRTAASLRYWSGQLRTIPQAMFAHPRLPVPAQGAPPAGWTPRLRIRSHTAAAALDVLAERTGVTRSTLVLTALCALTAHRAGQRQVVVTTLSANRFLPELYDYVGTVAQDALLSVTADAEGFEALARKVRRRTQLAYPHSWFDSGDLWAAIDAAAEERGARFARDCVFNDLSPLGLDGGVLRGAADPRDPAQEIQLTWLPHEPLKVDMMLWVYRLDGELDLSLWADPALLPAADAEAFGRGLAALFIEAARGDVKLDEMEDITGVAPAVRGPGWVVSDSGWIDLDQVAAAVATAAETLSLPRPAAVATTAEPDAAVGHRLVCRVGMPGPRGGGLTGREPDWDGTGAGGERADGEAAALAARLHAACVEALPGRPAVMAPHWYVIHEGVPEEPGDPAAWAALPVLHAGNGRAPRYGC
jgi:hypothetical protein